MPECMSYGDQDSSILHVSIQYKKDADTGYSKMCQNAALGIYVSRKPQLRLMLANLYEYVIT